MPNAGQYTRPCIAMSPVTRLLFDEMSTRGMTYTEMSRRSGVARTSIRDWRRVGKEPKIFNLEACFNVLGLTLTVKRIPRDA